MAIRLTHRVFRAVPIALAIGCPFVASMAPAAAATVTQQTSRVYAGYSYQSGGSTHGQTFTVSARFRLPAISCGAKPSGILPEAYMYTATSPTATSWHTALAGVAEVCRNGRASYFPVLIAAGAERDATKAKLHPGDTVVLTVKVGARHATVDVHDLTRHLDRERTVAGAPDVSAPGVGIGITYAQKKRSPIAPFGTLTFRGVNFDGTSLGASTEGITRYRLVNGAAQTVIRPTVANGGTFSDVFVHH